DFLFGIVRPHELPFPLGRKVQLLDLGFVHVRAGRFVVGVQINDANGYTTMNDKTHSHSDKGKKHRDDERLGRQQAFNRYHDANTYEYAADAADELADEHAASMVFLLRGKEVL